MRIGVTFLLLFLASCGLNIAQEDNSDAKPVGSVNMHSSEEDANLDRLERAITMPSGAQPLSSYNRFYASDDALVKGVFLLSAENPGERRWLDNPADLPFAFDGGCDIITMLYDPTENNFISIRCNGEA